MFKSVYAFFAGLGVVGMLMWIILAIVCAIFWVFNIYYLIMDLMHIPSPMPNEFLFRIILEVLGIGIGPLGSIMGGLTYFGFF